MPFLPDTTRRHVEPELMDSPSLGRECHEAALRGLARINTVSRSAPKIWSVLRSSLTGDRDGPYRVLDLGCGGGDVAAGLKRQAAREGVSLSVDGCDVSEQALQLARARAPHAAFFRLDALTDPLPTGYDAMVSSLFLHHLSREEATRLLRRMSEAAPAIAVNDLTRGASGYVVAALGTRFLTRSPIVHVDALRSVRAAFTPEEARDLAREAGLEGAWVRRAFPWRWLLGWTRP